jgi:carboxypeptidase family protein/TonB-dependent receptor-like protein
MKPLCLPALLFLLLVVLDLTAQVDVSGTLSGLVIDPTGAAYAGAAVTVTEQRTGLSVSRTTNSEGYYAVPLLKPGIYSIQVRAPGFVTLMRKSIVLQIQQTVRQDFQLQIGTVQQEVTVTGELPLLNSTTSEQGEVIPQRTIEQLPLNIANGRNFSQLAVLVPGTNSGPVGGIRGQTNSQGNGNETQRGGVEVVANGGRGSFDLFMIDGIDDRDQSVGTVKVIPNLESIQEFQVQTSNYEADFTAGGAIVNVLTRSGANQIHGSVFEFFRNSALDARQFFDNPTLPKPILQFNQFGFSIGAPIRKDKTFIFADYQGLRIHSATTSILTVPTPLMRSGNFTELPITIIDPTTSLPFSPDNNIIPAGRLDPIALKLLAIFPLPNLLGTANGTANNLQINPLRVQAEDQFDLRVDHVFSQRDTAFARYTWGRADITYPSTPVFLANGAINPLAFAQGGGIAGSLTLNHAPSQQATVQESHQFSPALTNQLAIGYTRFSLRVIPLAAPFNIAEQLGLQGSNTGSNAGGLASITISGQSGYNQSFVPEVVPQNTIQISDTLFYTHGTHLLRFGFSALQNRFGFFQLANPAGALGFSGVYTGFGFADFMLGFPSSSGKSTLPQGTPYARYGEYGFFVQDHWRATRRLTLSLGLRYDLFTPPSELHNRQSDFLFDTGQLIIAGQGGASRSILHTQKHDFSPRLGLAYRLNEKTVIRSGYGLYYFNEQGTGGSARLFINFPFAQQFTVSCSSTTPCLSTSVGIPQIATPNNLPTVVFQPVENLTPNIQQWHLTLERQLMPTLMMRVAYVGSHGNHLNIAINENVAFPGPGPVPPRQPYPQFGAIQSWEPRGISNYNALQVSAEKRYSQGLSFLAAYTWSKSLDEGGGGNSSAGDPRVNIQDPRNLRTNYGLSSFDYRHRFTLSMIYELPFGHGRRFMTNAGGWREALMGGWQTASILIAQSGSPFSVFLATPTANTGTFTRPDRICNGNLPSDVRSINRWFDTACFVAPPQFTFGDAGRNILIGPGLFTWDLGLDKDFHLYERVGMQFRAEFFNLLNRPNFGLPNAQIGSPAAGTIRTVVTNARQIQFGLRLHW